MLPLELSVHLIPFMIAGRSDKTLVQFYRTILSRISPIGVRMMDSCLLITMFARELIIFRIMSLSALAWATMRPVSPSSTERDRYKRNDSPDCGNSWLLSIRRQIVLIGSIRALETSPRRVFASLAITRWRATLKSRVDRLIRIIFLSTQFVSFDILWREKAFLFHV